MKTSLINRITWLALAASLLMALFIGLFIYFFSEHSREHHRRHDWRSMHFIARQIHEHPTPRQFKRIAEEFDVDLRYFNRNSKFKYATKEDMPNFEDVRKTRRRAPPGMTLGRVKDVPVIVHTSGPHLIMAVFPQPNSEESWNDTITIIAPLALALLFLWGGFYYMQRRLLAPLKILRDDMQKAGKGKWQESPIIRQDEIGELATEFNNMQKRLRNVVEAKGRFLADASHELRSPLARLRLAAEFVTDEKLRQRMTTDIGELDLLSSDILTKTRLENFVVSMPKKPLNIDELLKHSGDTINDTRIVLELNAAVIINGDLQSLRHAVDNLLNNALKFADKWVLLKSEIHDSAVLISVSDDGAGAATADLPYLFEPFYRADLSRSRNTGGFGMGLAIVQAAAIAHNGTATAKNNPQGGLTVTIKLPMEQSS